MRDKSGYWYTNKTLIRRLQITELEQQSMKTIINASEKYRRKTVKRDTSRRNNEGLTAREQAKQDVVERLAELRKRNPEMTHKSLAEMLGVTRQYVSKLLKGNRKCPLYCVWITFGPGGRDFLT